MKERKYSVRINSVKLKEGAILPIKLSKSLDKLVNCEEGKIIPLNKIEGERANVFIKVTRTGVDLITPNSLIQCNLLYKGLNGATNPEGMKLQPVASRIKVVWSTSVYLTENDWRSPKFDLLTQISYNKIRGLQLCIGIDKKLDKDTKEVLFETVKKHMQLFIK